MPCATEHHTEGRRGSWWKRTVDIAVATGAASFVVPAALKSGAAITLSMAGFTASGPAVGSLAAQWMSAIAVANGGAVPAGGMYAALQAAAMTTPMFSVPAAIVGTSAALYYGVRRRGQHDVSGAPKRTVSKL